MFLGRKLTSVLVSLTVGLIPDYKAGEVYVAVSLLIAVCSLLQIGFSRYCSSCF